MKKVRRRAPPGRSASEHATRAPACSCVSTHAVVRVGVDADDAQLRRRLRGRRRKGPEERREAHVEEARQKDYAVVEQAKPPKVGLYLGLGDGVALVPRVALFGLEPAAHRAPRRRNARKRVRHEHAPRAERRVSEGQRSVGFSCGERGAHEDGGATAEHARFNQVPGTPRLRTRSMQSSKWCKCPTDKDVKARG